MKHYIKRSEAVKKLWQNPEYRQHMSEAHKGYKHTPEQTQKIRLANLGRKNTEEAKNRMSKAVKGRISKYCGELHHWFGRSMSGSNHPRWIQNRTELKDDSKERGGQFHRNWSRSVKNRDKWKCKIANENCKGRVEAHHILGWRDYPELRFNVNNGITLCHAHHPRKRAEEKRLSPYFMDLVSVSNK